MEFENSKEEFITIISLDGLSFEVPNRGLFSVINREGRLPIHSKYFKFINGEIGVPKNEIIKICQLFSSFSIDLYDQIIKSKLYEFLEEIMDVFEFQKQHGIRFLYIEKEYKNIFFDCIFDFLSSANEKENFDDFLIRVKNFLENEKHIETYKNIIQAEFHEDCYPLVNYIDGNFFCEVQTIKKNSNGIITYEDHITKINFDEMIKYEVVTTRDIFGKIISNNTIKNLME